jgi:glucosyl-3-phosphoglycerate phosphatase
VSTPDRWRLVLVRHGETEWNAIGRWQGHGGRGLSGLGRSQAEITADWVAKAFDPVAFVARSDLERVAETSAPIEERLGVPVRVDARLRELDCGTWSGKTHDEVAAADPEGYAMWQRGEDVAPGGGERVSELQARVTAALRAYAEELQSGETAVVVTHGGPIRVGVAGLLGESVNRLDRTRGPVPNCSITVLAGGAAHVAIERYADASHLDGAIGEAPEGPL